MKLTKGTDLPHNLQEEVKRRFGYRLTTENGYPGRNPCGASVKPITDAKWLEDTAFYITSQGALSNRHKHCEPSYLA